MIGSYRDREAELIFNRRRSRRLPSDIQRVALRKLLQIDAATLLKTLRAPPGNRLEALAGDRKGQHANSDQRSMADLLCVARGRCL